MKHHIRILTITALLLISTVSSIAQNKPSNLKLPKGVIARLGNGEIYDIHYSPDGKQLAIGSSVGTWIYDTATWQPIHLLTKNDIASTHFAYHPTENTLATFDSDYTINLWNTDEGIRIRQLVPSNRINSIVFSANGDTIAIAKDDFRIRLLDTKTGREKLVIQRPCGDESDIRCIAFKPNGFILAAGERTGKIALWDSLTGEHILDLDANKEVRTVTYNNDGTILATGSASDNVVRLWDTNTNEQIQTLKPEGKIYGVNRIVFSADGGLLAAACLNGTIQLWDMNTFQHMKTLKHIGLSAVSFSPDLRSLASYSNYDGSVRIWNIFSGKTTHTITDFYGSYNCFAVSPDGITIACQGNNRNLYLFDATTSRLQKTIIRPNFRSVGDIAYSPDGKTFAGANQEVVALFDVKTGDEKHILKGHSDKVTSVAFSPDGNTVASGSMDNTIRLWNANTGEFKHTLIGHKESVMTVAFSPDGSTLASGGEDTTVYLWDANTGEIKTEIRKHGMVISDLSFSPDSKTVASAAYSPNIYLWDVATGKRKLFLKSNPSQITCIAFSPDGNFLAIGSATKGIYIYDAKTKRAIHNVVVNNRQVKSVAYAADGKTLVCLVNNIVYLLDLSDM